jgi:hypothetical protein
VAGASNAGPYLSAYRSKLVSVAMRRTDARAGDPWEVQQDIPQNVNCALSLGTLQSFVNANESLCNGRHQSCKIACRYHCRRDALYCLAGVFKITLRRTVLQPLHAPIERHRSASLTRIGGLPGPFPADVVKSRVDPAGGPRSQDSPLPASPESALRKRG